MTERKVLMVNTYISRDLEGNSLVGYLLKEKYGIDVVFVNGYELHEKIMHHKPDAVVWDHLIWDFKAVELKLAKKLGCKTFVLPTEGFFAYDYDTAKAAGPQHGAEPFLDIFFTWGQWVKDAIIKYKGLPESKLIVTGCPRFDFYNTDVFDKFYMDRKAFMDKHKIKNPDNPLIIWAPTSVMVGRNIKTRMRLYTKRSDISADSIKAVFDDGQIEFDEHSKLVMKLAEKHPEWNFIIKIHPVARVEPYLPIFEKYSNIYMGVNAHIRDYLYHCDALLQRNCTTGTEAWMLNKPVVQLEVANYFMPANQNYVDGNFVANSLESVEDFIIRVLNKEEVFTQENMACRHDFLTKFYFAIDGKASQRVSDVIGNMLRNEMSDQEHLDIIDKTTKKEKQYNAEQDAKLSNRFKDILHVKRTTSLRFWKLFMNREKKNTISEGEREPRQEEVAALYAKLDKILHHETVNI